MPGAPISRAGAIAIVKERAVADLAPTLSDDNVAAIVDRAARTDADGNLPTADDWTPTYDLNAAVADAWERKAALTYLKFDASIDGQAVKREQIHEHCLAQARMWRNRVVGKMTRRPPADPLVDLLDQDD